MVSWLSPLYLLSCKPDSLSLMDSQIVCIFVYDYACASASECVCRTSPSPAYDLTLGTGSRTTSVSVVGLSFAARDSKTNHPYASACQCTRTVDTSSLSLAVDRRAGQLPGRHRSPAGDGQSQHHLPGTGQHLQTIRHDTEDNICDAFGCFMQCARNRQSKQCNASHFLKLRHSHYTEWLWNLKLECHIALLVSLSDNSQLDERRGRLVHTSLTHVSGFHSPYNSLTNLES